MVTLWLKQGERTFEVVPGSEVEKRLLSEGFEPCDAPEVTESSLSVETGEADAPTGRGWSRGRKADVPVASAPEVTESPLPADSGE